MTLPATPQPPAIDWWRVGLRLLIWFSVVAAFAYAVSTGSLRIFEEDIHIAAEPNRERVALAGDAAPVIEVKVTLRNNTDKTLNLTAPSACKLFRWQIFSRAAEMMQSKVNEESCPTTEVTAFLPPGETLEEFYSIALVARRYRAGEDYLVRYWYWGHEGEFQFTAE